MSNSSIWSIDRALSGATIPAQSGPRSNVSEGVLHIPQSSSITGATPSDCLVLYPGHSFMESYTPTVYLRIQSYIPTVYVEHTDCIPAEDAGIQSVCSTAS